MNFEWQRVNFADDPFTVRFALGAIIVIVIITIMGAWFTPVGARIDKGESILDNKRRYSIKINSFDTDTLEATATVVSARGADCSEVIPKAVDDRCFVTPTKITDEGLQLATTGAKPDGFSPADKFYELPIPGITQQKLPWKSTETQKVTFRVLGYPARFPFDKNLIIGNVDQVVAYEAAGGNLQQQHLSAESIKIDFNFPGYEARRIKESELIYWVFPGERLKNIGADKLPEHYWDDHVFYFAVERPGLLPLLAKLIGAVALISIISVSVTTKPDEMAKTLAGSLISLWGLRSILGSSGPKVPTMLDYGSCLSSLSSFRYSRTE